MSGEGAITHRDSLGNEGRTEAGDVQVMHAGTGIVHAEYNRETAPTAAVPDLDPARPARRRARLGHAAVPEARRRAGGAGRAAGRATPAASALPLYADAAVLAGTLAKGETVRVPLAPGARRTWCRRAGR